LTTSASATPIERCNATALAVNANDTPSECQNVASATSRA